jgi:hypothetical protein
MEHPWLIYRHIGGYYSISSLPQIHINFPMGRRDIILSVFPAVRPPTFSPREMAHPTARRSTIPYTHAWLLKAPIKTQCAQGGPEPTVESDVWRRWTMHILGVLTHSMMRASASERKKVPARRACFTVA